MFPVPPARSLGSNFFAPFRRSITTHNVASNLPKHSFRRLPVARRAQNISDRYKHLENALRGKDALTQELQAATGRKRKMTTTTQAASVPTSLTFHGFTVPQEPNPPTDDECCMSGCAVCVYDLYEESLARYQDEVDALRKSLTAMKVPESGWPAHIRLKTNATISQRESQRKQIVLNAFEEMERQLALKNQKRMEENRKSLLLAQQQTRNWLTRRQEYRSVKNVLLELYEGIRWVLFSRR